MKLSLPRIKFDPRYFAITCLVATLGVQLILRVMWLSHGSLNVDESFFAACGVRALFEKSLPLLACVDNKPPGVFLFYQLTFRFFGAYNMYAIHLLGMVWVFLTAAVVFLGARELVGRTAACWAAIFYLILTSGDYHLLAVKTELLAALPLSLSLWLFARSLRLNSRTGMFGAGVMLAGAILFKQPAVLACGGIGAVLLATSVSPGSFRDSFVNGLCFLAGLATLLGLLVLCYWLAHGLDDLIYQTIQYPSQYATVNSTSPAQRVMRLVASVEEYSRLAPYCWLAAIAGCFVPGVANHTLANGSGRAVPARLFVGALLFAMLCAVSLGRGFYLAYYIFLFPLLAIAGGRFMQLAQESGNPLRMVACILGSLAIASNCIMLGKEPLKRFMAGDKPSNSSEISKRINSLSKPGDRLYVWGYAPDYFVETHLVGASKVLLSDHLQGLYAEYTPGLKPSDRMHLVKPEMWQRFMTDLEKNQPHFIVDISEKPLGEAEAITFSPVNYPRLRDYLASRCKVDMTERGIKLYVCNEDSLTPPAR